MKAIDFDVDLINKITYIPSYHDNDYVWKSDVPNTKYKRFLIFFKIKSKSVEFLPAGFYKQRTSYYGGDAYWSQVHEDEFTRYNYVLKNSPIANGGKEAWKKAYVLIGLTYTEDISQHFDTDEEAIAWINKLKELSNKTFETIEYKN